MTETNRITGYRKTGSEPDQRQVPVPVPAPVGRKMYASSKIEYDQKPVIDA